MRLSFPRPLLVISGYINSMLKFPRLYMDGWRDGLNRLWRDGVTILPRPAEKIATAKNNRPVPALGKKKKNTAPSRPVEKKKKPPRPASEKNNNRPVPPRKKKQPPRPASEKKQNRPVPPRKINKTPRPAMNSKIHRPEGGNWKQISPPVSFSLFLVAHLYRIVV